MEREYIGGDVIIWREKGTDRIDLERINEEWIKLTISTPPEDPIKKIPGFGTVWIDPKTADELGRALIAYAEVCFQGGGYCHDPLADYRVLEDDSFFFLLPRFKASYRHAMAWASRGDKDGLAEQHRLIDMLTRRINAHLGDGMPKAEGIKKGEIF